jgi:hypothetical protein
MDLVAPVANMLMAAITKGASRHDERPFSWLSVSSEEVENSVGQTLRQFHSGHLHTCSEGHP